MAIDYSEINKMSQNSFIDIKLNDDADSDCELIENVENINPVNKNKLYVEKKSNKANQNYFASSENGIFMFSQDPELENYMFGNFAMVIELNNLLAKVYVIAETNESEIPILEFKSFLEVIQSSSDSPKQSFINLVKSLLKISIREKSFQFFGFNFNTIDIHDCLLNEICKIFVAFNFLNLDPDLPNDELPLISPDESIIKKSNLLKALNDNKSFKAFSNLDVILRLYLIYNLLLSLISGEKFELYLQAANDKVLNLYARLRQGEDSFIEKIGIERNVFSTDKKRYYEQGLIDLKLKRNVEKLKEININLQSSKSDLKRLKRIEPLGIDSKGHIYWHFSFYKRIIIEKTLNEKMSEWYAYNSTQSKNLVKQLKSTKEDSKLITVLNEKMTLIFDNEDQENDETIILPATVSDYKQTSLLNKERTFEEEWLSYFSKCNTDDDLVLLITNHQLFFDYYGFLKKNSLENLKNKLQEYQFLENSSEKFKNSKKILTEIYSNIWGMIYVNKCVTTGRLTIYKKCVESSESFLNLCFMVYVYFRIIRWEVLKEAICKDCNKEVEKFSHKINKLNEFYEQDFTQGSYYCFSCHSFYHKQCVLKKGEICFGPTGLFVCTQCDEKKKGYYLADENSIDKIKGETSELSDNEDGESHKLRKRRQIINYNETSINENRRQNRKSNESKSPSSTRSKIRPKKEFKQPTSLPTRNSSRIASSSKKSYTDLESDNEN